MKVYYVWTTVEEHDLDLDTYQTVKQAQVYKLGTFKTLEEAEHFSGELYAYE